MERDIDGQRSPNMSWHHVVVMWSQIINKPVDRQQTVSRDCSQGSNELPVMAWDANSWQQFCLFWHHVDRLVWRTDRRTGSAGFHSKLWPTVATIYSTDRYRAQDQTGCNSLGLVGVETLNRNHFGWRFRWSVTRRGLHPTSATAAVRPRGCWENKSPYSLVKLYILCFKLDLCPSIWRNAW